MLAAAGEAAQIEEWIISDWNIYINPVKKNIFKEKSDFL